MRARCSLLTTLLLVCLASVTFLAQAPQPAQSPTVPRLVHFSGVFQPADGMPAAPVEEVTFGIYAEETGGVPLWEERQSLAIDAAGRYVALLGATVQDGVPLEVFASGEPRYLGLVWGRAPQATGPRLRLTSVPYALRAVDAETLGGLPASAFLRVDGNDGAAGGAGAATNKTASTTDGAGVALNTGTANFLGKFVDGQDLTSSVLYENAGRIGLGTTTPRDMLHSQFSDSTGGLTGFSVQNTHNGAGAYSGMLFYDHTGSLGLFQGFNNVSKEYRINNIAPNGSVSFMINFVPRFSVRNDGDLDISGSVRRNGLRFLHNVGSANTGVGRNALSALTVASSGRENTAVGDAALAANTDGRQNVAVGSAALTVNTTGIYNVAVGDSTLRHAITATGNTAVGQSALNVATAGQNTAVGAFAMTFNTTGNQNTAVGVEALRDNLNGINNVAIGWRAMFANQSGLANVAVGLNALLQNTAGSSNTAVGQSALANIQGHYNVGIGYQAGRLSTGSYNIYVGYDVVANPPTETRTIRIGDMTLLNTNPQTYKYERIFTGGIYNGLLVSGDRIQVYVDENGQLGFLASSRRYKEDIEDVGNASSNLMKLRPVSFRYKPSRPGASRPIQYGLIAEDVADVYPELVKRSATGEIETVHYDLVNALLLNEVQKQHRALESQQSEIQTQRTAIAELTARLAALERLLATEKK